MPRWLYGLLLFAILAALSQLLHVPLPPLILFSLAALGIIPLAAMIGQAVEQIAEHTGERIGGLLFATFGNATELIIGIFALRDGLVDVVRASIIGSILGNALLVLGISTLIGSIKSGRLHFETRPASQYASLLALCVGGLLLPTFAELLAAHERHPQAQIVQNGILLSDCIAVLLLVGYLASILFSVFRLGDKPDEGEEEKDQEFVPIIGGRSALAVMRLLTYRHTVAHSKGPGKTEVLHHIDNTVAAIVDHEVQKEAKRSEEKPEGQAPMPSVNLTRPAEDQRPTAQAESVAVNKSEPLPLDRPEAVTQQKKKPALLPSLLVLALATIGVGYLSDILVGSIEPLTAALHWNPAFVGLVFVPLIGGLPEYFNTITMALDKRMGMVLAASAGSSIQIALLMAPVLILVSVFTPVRLDLVFNIVELAVLGLATFLFSEITRDGELVWLEGLLLILLYAMMAGTIFIFGA